MLYAVMMYSYNDRYWEVSEGPLIEHLRMGQTRNGNSRNGKLLQFSAPGSE